MKYSKSIFRKDFEDRILILKRRCDAIENDNSCRDMAYQSAIFQTNAAIETYIKLIIESWVQQLKINDMHHLLPAHTRSFALSRGLEPHYLKYGFRKDESELIEGVIERYKAWQVFDERTIVPLWFGGHILTEDCSYP